MMKPMKKRMNPGGADKRLRAAFARGEILDLRTGHPDRDDPSGGAVWAAERQVRADVIAGLICAGTGSVPQRIAALSIAGARIIGRLDLCYARIEHALVMKDCYFDEPADFSEAQAVSICLEGSRLQSLACYDLRVEEDFDCAAVIAGSIDLFGAHIGGRFWLQGAQLRTSDGSYALNAPDLTVGGGMYCRGARATGGVNMYGATIGSGLELTGATLSNSDGAALRAPGLRVGSDMDCGRGFTATGAIDLFGAQIGGQLWMGGACLSRGDRDGDAVNAPLLKVDGGTYCNAGFHAIGRVNLFGATIGSTLEFDGATLNNPEGTALRAPGSVVRADMTCTSGFAVAGAIDLSGARIGGELRLEAATFTSTTADLRKADIRVLSGEPSSWPGQLRLNELTYTALEPYLPADQWLSWLRRDPGGYQPQPYEQLAACYRRLGHDEQARTVLLAKHRHRRKRLRPAAKAWGHVQDAAVGYGYRPARAFAWLVLLVAVTAIYFTANPPHAAGGGTPQFQPVIYAFDTVVPVLDLGQQNAYIPAGAGQWIAWIVTVAGWVLATAVIAGITRTLTRN